MFLDREMKISVDWQEISSLEEFYDSFLIQIQAPDWHGHNLDALNDSIVNGDINGIEPPYEIENINFELVSDYLKDFQRKVFEIFQDASLEKDIHVTFISRT